MLTGTATTHRPDLDIIEHFSYQLPGLSHKKFIVSFQFIYVFVDLGQHSDGTSTAMHISVILGCRFCLEDVSYRKCIF